MYNVIISNIVEKELDKLPDNIFLKIDKVIQALKDNPRPIGCIKLTDINGYRIRIGDYRLLYTVSDKALEIHLLKVAHRKDAYKKK